MTLIGETSADFLAAAHVFTAPTGQSLVDVGDSSTVKEGTVTPGIVLSKTSVNFKGAITALTLPEYNLHFNFKIAVGNDLGLPKKSCTVQDGPVCKSDETILELTITVDHPVSRETSAQLPLTSPLGSTIAP